MTPTSIVTCTLLSWSLLGTVPPLSAEEPAVVKPVRLPVVQIIRDDCVPNTPSVNGFPLDGLLSVRAHDRAVDGFSSQMERYYVLHPYFLRPGTNRIDATYHLDLSSMIESNEGPWALNIILASVSYPGPLKPFETRSYVGKTLGHVTSPSLLKTAEAATPATLTGTFEWKDSLPAWTWTTGVRIERSDATRASLYAEYARIHDGLMAVRAATDRSAAARTFAAPMRATMSEYIQASELRGKRFGFLDEVAYAGAFLERGIISDELAAAAASAAAHPKPVARPTPRPEPVPSQEPVQDGGGGDDTPPGPDGIMPPRLQLRDLPPLSEVTLELLANGTLARLLTSDAGSLIVFSSNYKDGPWGQQGTKKLEADIWFRRTASGTWAVDAMWPDSSAREQWGTLDQLLSDLDY